MTLCFITTSISVVYVWSDKHKNSHFSVRHLQNLTRPYKFNTPLRLQSLSLLFSVVRASAFSSRGWGFTSRWGQKFSNIAFVWISSHDLYVKTLIWRGSNFCFFAAFHFYKMPCFRAQGMRGWKRALTQVGSSQKIAALKFKSKFSLVTCNSPFEIFVEFILYLLKVKFHKFFQGGNYKLQVWTLIYFKKYSMGLFNKMKSRKKLQITILSKQNIL